MSLCNIQKKMLFHLVSNALSRKEILKYMRTCDILKSIRFARTNASVFRHLIGERQNTD